MAIINTICPFCFNKVALTELKCECIEGHTESTGTPIEFFQQRVKCKVKSCGKDIIHFRCPRCEAKLPKSILHTENLLFSIIGVSDSGKTNYITVMLEELNKASNLKFALFSQNVETRNHQRANYKELYENHKKPEMTSSGTQMPQIWGIKKLEQNFIQKLCKEVSAYTFIIYDGAGEDHEQITENPSLCKYIAISKAMMVVIDPMILHSVKRSLDRDIYDKSTGGGISEDNDKNSIDIVNGIADFIRDACGLRIGAQVKVPVAVIFTKMDALMDEFKNRTVSMPSPHVNSGYFDYTDAREVDKDIREWLSVKGEYAFINALKSNFTDFTFFGISSYGDLPVSKNELKPIRPHRVLDPILWLFAKNKYINAK
jgi:hypothetical protein